MTRKRFNPCTFDCMDYISTFHFCDMAEKREIHRSLLLAWLWAHSELKRRNKKGNKNGEVEHQKRQTHDEQDT